jgi:hypothetical protein
MADAAPLWLTRYYGKHFDRFSPTVIMEGKFWAIVRINKEGTVAYVLVKRKGNHESTPHVPLFQGNPTADDITKMQEILFNKDIP